MTFWSSILWRRRSRYCSGNWQSEMIIISMECDGGYGLMTIVAKRNGKICLLTIFHYDMLIKSYLMGSEYLFLTASFLLLVNRWVWTLIRTPSFMILVIGMSIVRVSSLALPSGWIINLFQFCFIFLQLSLLGWHTILQLLILRHQHLKSLLVAILYTFHLHTKTLYCRMQILDHRGELIVLLNQLFHLVGIETLIGGLGQS